MVSGQSIINVIIEFKMTHLLFLETPFKAYQDPMGPGGRLNKKDGLTRYGNSHVKDKTS